MCDIYAFNDYIKPMDNMSLIDHIVDVETKEGHIYILEINNDLGFRNHKWNTLMCTNQARAATTAIG